MAQPTGHQAWGGAGVLYLAACMLGLAAGLWPDAIYPNPRESVQAAPLPTLRTLAVAQAVFVLLVWPLALMRRRARADTPPPGHDVPAAGPGVLVLRCAMAAIVTVPFYLVAAFLADAHVRDVIRSATFTAALVPPALAVAAWMGGRWRTPAIVLLLVVVAGLPWAYYFAREFLPERDASWLWNLTPCLYAWSNADAAAGWLPAPPWALFVWPATGAVLAATRALFGRRA